MPSWGYLSPAERDQFEFEDPCADIPTEVYLKDLEENPD